MNLNTIVSMDLQAIVLPNGELYGRLYVPNQPGRVNQLRHISKSENPMIWTQVQEYVIEEIGECVLPDDLVQKLTNSRALDKEEKAIIRVSAKNAWDTGEETEDAITVAEYLGSNHYPETPGTNESKVGDLSDPTSALIIYDNPDAYKVPERMTEWVPVKFTDTEIDAFEYLDRARADKSGELSKLSITGRTGSGKSSLLHAYAAERGIPIAKLPIGESTDLSTIGDDIVLRNGETIRALTPVGMVIKHGGILELAEPNGAADSAIQVLYGLLDFGSTLTLSNGAVIPVHPDCLIVATMNPVDAAHTHAKEMSAALERRFWPVELDYDEEIERKLVPSEAMQALKGDLRRAKLSRPFGTDSLLKVHKAATTFGLAQALTGLKHMYRSLQDREVVSTLIEVHSAGLASDYNQSVKSNVEDITDDILDQLI